MCCCNEKNPVGTVNYFARQLPPEGWLLCDGREVSRDVFADLFNMLGNSFGTGDGKTTFNLPDLRGEFIRGLDKGRGVDDGRVFGSSQISTQVLVDDESSNVVGVIDWTNNDLPKLGYETAASQAKGDIHFNNSNIVKEITNEYFRSIRPRNVALLACIKY